MDTANLPKEQFKNCLQIGAVVTDLEQTIQVLTNVFGFGPFRIFDWPPPDRPDIEEFYYGKRVHFKARKAFTDMGSVELELIQPLEGQSIYFDFLKEHGPGLHHIRFNISELEPVIEYLAQNNFEVSQMGSGLRPGTRWANFNTEQLVGFTIEVMKALPGTDGKTPRSPGETSRTQRYALAQRRIQAAFDLADPVDPAVMVWPVHYIVYGTDPEAVPEDLFENAKRLMEFQVKWCEQHLAAVQDDFQPYLTPYYGTGILASAFGCKTNFYPGRDPSVAGPCITSPAEAARLRLPDPQRDGLMPRVLETAAYLRAHGPYPVSLTDMQSPLDELILMCGHERLYLWMYDEPNLVHELMALVSEAFVQWVQAQKAVTGEAWNVCHGEQGVWLPPGCGVWLADDEAVNLSPRLYAEFVAPHYPHIFKTFGSGLLHFCGDGSHHATTLLQMEGLRAINTGPMSKPANFTKLQRATQGKIPLIYQELAPVDLQPYYQALLKDLSLRGVVFCPQVSDTAAISLGKGFVEVEQNRAQAAQIVYQALQQAIKERKEQQ